MTIRQRRRGAAVLAVSAALVFVTTGVPATGNATTPRTEGSGGFGVRVASAELSLAERRARGLLAPGTTAADSCSPSWIHSPGDGPTKPPRWVAAEWDPRTHGGNRYGMLRARTAEQDAGRWEEFVACRHAPTGMYYFSTLIGNGDDAAYGQSRFVTAEQGTDYTGSLAGMLRARGTSVGKWELFFAVDASTPTENYWALRSFEGLDSTPFVSADWNHTGNNAGMLRARSASVGPWERLGIFGLG